MHVAPLGPSDPNTSQAFLKGLEIDQGDPQKHWQQYKLLGNFKKKSPSGFFADTPTIYQRASRAISYFTTTLPHLIEAEGITSQGTANFTQLNSFTKKTVIFGALSPPQKDNYPISGIPIAAA